MRHVFAAMLDSARVAIWTIGGWTSAIVERSAPDDALSYFAASCPPSPEWLTVWTTDLTRLGRALFVVGNVWRLPSARPYVDRGLAMTALVAPSLRIVFRALSSWAAISDQDLASDYNTSDTPAGLARALGLWHQEIRDLIKPAIPDVAKSSAAAVWSAWMDLHRPAIPGSLVRASGVAPGTAFRDAVPHPHRPGIHDVIRVAFDPVDGGVHYGINSDDPTGEAAPLAVSTLFESRALDGDTRWNLRADLLRQSDRIIYRPETAATAAAAELERHSDACKPGRQWGPPRWLSAWWGRGGDQEAKRLKLPLETLPDGWQVWHADIRRAYPAALADAVPWPYQWADDDLDVRPINRGGPTGGIVRAHLRFNTELPVIPVRAPGDGDGPPVLCWPRRGAATVTIPLELLRFALGHGVTIERVFWCRTMRHHWYPFASLASTMFDIEQHARTGSPRNTVKRLLTRLYGRIQQRRVIQQWISLRAYVDDAGPPCLPLVRFGDHLVTRALSPLSPLHAMPSIAAHVEARVSIALAEAELSIREAGGVVVGFHTDGIVFAAPTSGDLPAVKLAWGDRPGQWRLVNRGAWVVWARPGEYAIGTGDDVAVYKAAGIDGRTIIDYWTGRTAPIAAPLAQSERA